MTSLVLLIIGLEGGGSGGSYMHRIRGCI